MNLKKICGPGLLWAMWTLMGVSAIVFGTDQDYSEIENRPLQTKPPFEMTSYLNGDYQNQVQQYINDQMLGKNQLVRDASQLENILLRGKKENVYISQKKRLLQEVEFPQYDHLDELNQIERPITLMIVPTPIAFYEEECFLPSSAISQVDILNAYKDQLNSRIRYINMVDVLKPHKDEAIYFKTDHHWTSLGAKYGAEAFLNKTFDAVETYLVRESFYGSLARQIGYTKTTDEMVISEPQHLTPYIVENVETKKISTSIYDLSKIESADPYTIYFGGNYPCLKITTKKKNKKSLMVIKDSYANVLMPYLINEYEQIIMLDPRYSEYKISDFKVDEILVCMNENLYFNQEKLFLFE